jgi:hypothetical protein
MPLQAPQSAINSEYPVLSEYVVRVVWLKAVPKNEALGEMLFCTSTNCLSFDQAVLLSKDSFSIGLDDWQGNIERTGVKRHSSIESLNRKVVIVALKHNLSSIKRDIVMKRPKKNKEREERITMEIIVDANGPDEQAMGWYYYLEEKLHFPFTAICCKKRAISPLRVEDEVDIIGMAPAEECEREMFVTMRWEKDGLAVPLSQLIPISETSAETIEAVEDWHYWVKMGYKFC